MAEWDCRQLLRASAIGLEWVAAMPPGPLRIRLQREAQGLARIALGRAQDARGRVTNQESETC